MRGAWLVLVCAASGCYEADNLTCGDLLCPHAKVCSPILTCVDQNQLDACAGAADGAACTTASIPTGVCVQAICIAAGCGNSFVEPGEACDDGNRVSFDGCRADCTSTESCGDGIVDPAFGEACDCGTSDHLSATCTQPNGPTPGAACREDCKLARCGDGIVDPDELCDDGNTAGGDGCRADCQGRFTKMQTPIAFNLRDVWTTGPNAAWALAESSNPGERGVVIYYDGVTWVDIGPGGAGTPIGHLWASGPTDVYVTSSDEVLHFDGLSWTAVSSGPTIKSGVWGIGPDDVYVIGWAAGGALRVSHFNGTTWAPVTICTQLTQQAALITGTSSSNVFISSAQGVCRFNGTSWALIGANVLDALSAGSETEVYGRRTADLESWTGTGTTWNTYPIPASGAEGIDVVAPDSVMVVGFAGGVLGRRANVWTHYVVPTEQTLHAIHSTSETNVFIVGDVGTVLH